MTDLYPKIPDNYYYYHTILLYCTHESRYRYQ